MADPSTEAPHSAAGAMTSRSRMADAIWLCCFLMAGLVVMSIHGADNDLWGHVTYGKDVLRDGYLHPTTTWSYAVDDFRWVNHENIAELSMAAADMLGGQTGLLLLKSFLILVILGTPVFVARRQGAGLIPCLVIVAMLVFNMAFHSLMRPHLFSYALFVLMMAALVTGLPGATTDRDNTWRFGRSLWFIPIILCVWTNAHGGYLAGLAILAAWLGLDAGELLINRDSRLRSTVYHHAILFSVSVGACLINPYGLELHRWMLSSLGRQRPEIMEWAPLALLELQGAPFWAMVFAVVLSLRNSTTEIRWPGLLMTGLVAVMAILHRRHLPFVAMSLTFVLAPHLQSAWQAICRRMEQQVELAGQSPVARRPRLAMPVAVLIALCCLQYPKQAILPVEREIYPVSAMEFMDQHDLYGNVFVTFNWAQYAIGVFSENSPESRVAYDGRFRTCYPQHIIDMYSDFVLGDLPPTERYREAASGPFDPDRALEFHSPDLVLFERMRANCIEVMERNSETWCLLYQDSRAQLWGRRSIFDDPASPRYLPQDRRDISDELQHGIVEWPAIPKSAEIPVRVARTRELAL